MVSCSAAITTAIIAVLYLVVLKPIGATLRDRRARIEQGIHDADQARIERAAGEAAAPLVVASHVPAGVTFDPSAPPVSGVTQIDTTNHTITIGAGAPGLPAGVTFADHAGVAVLLTGDLTRSDALA